MEFLCEFHESAGFIGISTILAEVSFSVKCGMIKEQQEEVNEQ